MDDKTLVLINSIRQDLAAIATIYAELEHHPLQADTDEDTLIVISYHLHNLYNAFENIFRNIATMFENSVDEMERWHVQLLERMRLDISPLRPAVIDDAAYDALDELRRFRHLFRHAYSVKLDPLRLQLVIHKALALKAIYAGQLGRFVDFLQGLA
jgi:ferredoxin-fold anticodon binding domain-containing protein